MKQLLIFFTVVVLILTLGAFRAAGAEYVPHNSAVEIIPAYSSPADTTSIGLTDSNSCFIAAMEMERSIYKIKPGAIRQLELLILPADSHEELVWTSSDPSIVQVDASGLVTGMAYGSATVTVSGKNSGMHASCTVKVCDVKQIAFTFDDGPSKHTVRLLNFLKENGISATFFLVGNRVPIFEKTVKRQVAEGHEIGYHSYSHKNHTKLSSEQIVSEFSYASKQLLDLTGTQYTLWRSPGGNFDQRILDCIPLPHICWSVDTRDWSTRNSEAVYRAIMNHAWDGAIILLHDLYANSVEGAIRAMEVLNQGDYEFLTVTELLSREGTPPKNCMSYPKG